MAAFAVWILAGSASAQEPQWLTDYHEAVEKAKAENKPILLYFSASDWNVWCPFMKDKIFRKAEFRNFASQNLILMEVDFPAKKRLPKARGQQNSELSVQYKVSHFPVIVFVDANGKELGRQDGCPQGGPASLIEIVNKFRAPAPVASPSAAGSGWGGSGTWGGGWK